MRKKQRSARCCLLAGLLFISLCGTAQVDSLLAIARNVFSYEAVYLHADKDNYVAGENIWFKAYLRDASYPSGQSSSLQVQLLDSSGTVRAEKVYPVISGITNGNILLPAGLLPGRYFIRAMGDARTRQSVPFVMPLIVLQPSSAGRSAIAPYTSTVTLQYHAPNPLVNGIADQFYAQALDAWHQPVNTTIWLLNGQRDTVSSFRTDASGIADIRFIPDSAIDYSLATQGVLLPVSRNLFAQEGISMIIDEMDSMYIVGLQSALPVNKHYRLVGESGYQLLFSLPVSFVEERSVIQVPVRLLPAGITRMALLTDNGDAACERFVFSGDGPLAVTSSFQLGRDATPGNWQAGLRDSAGASLSINATDPAYDFGSPYPRENITGRFLLGAWLRQPFPAYASWFSSGRNIRHLATALLGASELALPHWREIERTRSIPVVQPVDYINLEGQINEGKSHFDKSASLRLEFHFADSGINTYTVPLGADGRFSLKNLVFSDTAALLYALYPASQRDIRMTLGETDPAVRFAAIPHDNRFLQWYPPAIWVAESTATNVAGQQSRLRDISDAALVQDLLPPVTVQGIRTLRQKQLDLNSQYTHDVFARSATQLVDLVNEPFSTGRGQNVLDYLKIYGRRMGVTAAGIIKTPVLWSPQYYTLFLDEGAATIDDYESIDVQDVAMIKIFADNFILGDANGPAIAVYTKKEKDMDKSQLAASRKLKIKGYGHAASFLNPEPGNTGIKRETLHSTFAWYPYITLTARHPSIQIQLLNPNHIQVARVRVEGMSPDGKLYSAEYLVHGNE